MSPAPELRAGVVGYGEGAAAQAVCAAVEASAAQGRWVAVTGVTGAPSAAR